MRGQQAFKYWAWPAAVCAVLILLTAPAPTIPPTQTAAGARDEGWFVPRLASRGDIGADVAELARSGFWGGQFQADTQVDDRAKQWRVAGLAGQAKDRHVLVQFGDDRILPLKAGDRFPDGTLIADIKDNGVCVQIEGKKRLLPLVGQAIPIVW